MSPTPVAGRLDVTTGKRTLQVPVTWFPAAGPAAAVVWLQHGFARSRRRMVALATFLAGHGFAVLTTTLRTVDPFARTVQNLGDNTAFLDSLAQALADGLPASWRQAGLSGGPPPQLLAAGHSAGGDAAAYVVGQLAYRGDVELAGAVLLDPVTSVSGSNLADGLRLARDATIPIRIVAAAPSRCNNHGSGVATALTELAGFAGVRLTTGSHLDAEGPDADRLAVLVCGAPLAANVVALQELTHLWLWGMVDGTRDEQHDSPLVTALVADGQAEALWGQAGSTSSTR